MEYCLNVQAWGEGFGTLLSFSMQMTLIVVTGYALATTSLCKKLITSLCCRPSTAPKVYLRGVLLSAVGYYLNWEFGLILTALSMMIIFLYGTPAKLLIAVKAATPASWGIILQFPFYAGIFGIMKFTGLVDIMVQWIIGFSTAATYPAIVAILTNVIGYFIPSGGSKWAIEAPFLIPAGHTLGVPDAKTTIAYMFGCDWVGLIQPFFAVPFMAVTGLEFKDFVGYTFIAYLLLGILTLVGLTFLPF